MGNSNHTGRAWSIPSGLAMGAVVSMAATVIISFIGAQMILNEILPQDQIGYCALAALLISAMLGAVTATNKIKHRRLLICILSGCVYCSVLLAVTALFFGGQYEGFGITFLTILLGSVTSAILTNGSGERHRQRKRKK